MDQFLEPKSISEFKDLIGQDKLVFVQFTTKMCHPSDMIKGYLDQLIEKHPNVAFVKVYVDQHTVSSFFFVLNH
jgi:thioredoxin 1